MIRVQLAGAADFAALLAAYAPSRPGRPADAARGWDESARPVPHRAERTRAERTRDEAERVRPGPALGAGR